jgi:hypothetical protein
MFHLWIGVMAGVLLAYLIMRAQRSRPREMWRSWRWWSAGVAALIVVLPVVWELVQTAAGFFGPLEALKTVLLPWAAGVGFGIWLYLAIAPLWETTKGEADAVRRDLSLIPIAVALLFVSVIVSDQQYGWLARLQKLNIGGGGIELSPQRSAAPGATQEVKPALAGFTLGEGRVTALIDFLQHLDEAINRDIEYIDEVGYGVDDDALKAALKKEFLFARLVAKPLGEHLSYIHNERGYNNLGILIDRTFIDSFRAFVLSHRDNVGQALKRQLAMELYVNISPLWLKICRTEERLAALRPIHLTDEKEKEKVRKRKEECDSNIVVYSLYSWLGPEESSGAVANLWSEMCGSKDLVKSEESSDLSARKLCLEDRARPENAATAAPLVRDHPYGTLLASMMLFADDDVDAAIRDIDNWVAENISDAKLEENNASDSESKAKFYKRFGIYRALARSVQLLRVGGDFDAARVYSTIEHIQTLLKIGDKLFASTHYRDSQLSWRTQRDRFGKRDGIDSMWALGICSNDLTKPFKTMMKAHLAAKNNFTFYLTENVEFAERANLMEIMEEYADYLGKKVNVRCLDDDDRHADQTQATFLDTVAGVELTLGRKKKDRSDKRRRLCEARKHAERAVKLQESTLTASVGRPSDFRNQNDLATQRGWHAQLDQRQEVADWIYYVHRLENVRRQLADEGIDCS